MNLAHSLRFRLRRWVATRIVTVALLTLVVAAVGAGVLATAAGARRTETAPDRFTAAFGVDADLSLRQEGGPPTDLEVAALPAIARLDSATFMFAAVFPPDVPDSFGPIAFAGSPGGLGSRLIEGRLPARDNMTEFVATENYLEATGISIGDAAQVITLTEEDRQEFGFSMEHATGPRFEARLVGVIRGAGELEDPTPYTVFSRAMIEDGRVGLASTLMNATLADGATEQDLRDQLDTLPQGNQYVVEPSLAISADIRTAVRGQSIGLWLLAGLGALAASAALGHLIARSVRLSRDEEQALASLGYTRRQLVAESALRAAVLTVAAMVLAIVVAALTSGIFPFGFVRQVEPAPGVRVEWLVLIGGALVVGCAIVGWVVVAAAWRRRDARSRRPALVETMATRAPSPTIATGLRFAFTSRSGESASLIASLGGMALTVAVLVGTLTFASSLTRFVHEPVRYGTNFDMMMDNGAGEINDELRGFLVDDPGVNQVNLYATASARVADTTIPVVRSEPLRAGGFDPVLLEGRLPVADDEVGIGRVSGREIGAAIGDTITMSTPAGSGEFTVTGFLIAPGIGGNDLLGVGAVLPLAGFEPLFPGLAAHAAGVRFVDGPAGDSAKLAIAQALDVDPSETQNTPPSAITQLRRITFVPFALAVLLVVLAAVVLIGSIYTGIRRRDEQVAVLRALGADRRWLVAGAWWQALATTLVPACIGVPIGLIAGRLVFRDFADERGGVSEPSTPFGYGLLALGGLLVVGAVVAVVGGRRARVGPPALLLRTA